MSMIIIINENEWSTESDYRNICNLSQVSLNKWPSHIPVLC